MPLAAAGPRSSRLGAIAVALVCGLLALAGRAHAETVLHARLNSDILSTDPGTRRDENTDGVLLHVVEGLVASRNDGSVAPMLAKSWKVSDDGRIYTFSLRSGIVFHNGAPLTAADVVWSLKRYLAPATHWRCLSEFTDQEQGRILSVDAPDRDTVRIVLDRPAPLLLKTLARADCGDTGILQRASVGPDGRWRYPIGTGPFKFVAWAHNRYIELARFTRYKSLPGPPDGYVGGKHPLVDKLRFEIIPDSSAAVAALFRGSLDVLDGLSSAELSLVRREPGIRIEMSPTLDFYAVLFRTEDPLLKDPRLRRAIALTIDTPALVKAITWGTARPDNSPIPVVSPYFGPAEARLREPNIAEARSLSRAAGYHGQPIALLTNHRYPLMFNAAVLVQAMAAKAGINLEIRTLDWGSQLARYLSGSYQAMSFAYSTRLDPSLNFAALIGDKRHDRRKVWDTGQVRALLKSSMRTSDPAARQMAFDKLNDLFMRDVPAIVLFNTTRIAAIRPGVQGFKEWPGGLPRYWDVSLR